MRSTLRADRLAHALAGVHDSVRVLALSESVLSAVHAHCEVEHPREACGLLLGRLTDDGARTVLFVVTARNGAPRPEQGSRFEISPRDLLVADDAARAAGLDIVGVYHSHPEEICVPSLEDHAVAQPGWSYLIVALVQGRVGETRSFSFDARMGLLVEEVLNAR